MVTAVKKKAPATAKVQVVPAKVIASVAAKVEVNKAANTAAPKTATKTATTPAAKAANKPVAKPTKRVAAKAVAVSTSTVERKSAVKAKPVAKSATKLANKLANKLATKSAAKPVKSNATKPIVATVSKEKHKKPKLVRDSFTMPEAEYAVLSEVKKACIAAGIEVKKSQLLRVGLVLLKASSVTSLKTMIEALPALKAGRPKAEK